MKWVSFLEIYMVSGLDTFTCVTAGQVLPFRFTNIIANVNGKFCTALVVSLLGRRDSNPLKTISLAWRTHTYIVAKITAFE